MAMVLRFRKATSRRFGRRLLDFGPDTGHLTWARIDPVRLIGRYRDRAAGLHVKDVRLRCMRFQFLVTSVGFRSSSP
jgi:sugar phosphate isomerase/epimerase